MVSTAKLLMEGIGMDNSLNKCSSSLEILQTILFLTYISTGGPKIKLALANHLEIAIHGFKMCILHVKGDELNSNPSRPLLGHP